MGIIKNNIEMPVMVMIREQSTCSYENTKVFSRSFMTLCPLPERFQKPMNNGIGAVKNSIRYGSIDASRNGNNANIKAIIMK